MVQCEIWKDFMHDEAISHETEQKKNGSKSI